MDLFDTQRNQRQTLVQNLVRPFLRETNTRVNVTTTFSATIRAYEQSIEFPNQTSNARQRVVLASVSLGFSWSVKNVAPGLGNVEVQFFPQTRVLEVLELTLHSSELLAGANPYFRETYDIEKLYHDFNCLFSHIASRQITGVTLADYRRTYEVKRGSVA